MQIGSTGWGRGRGKRVLSRGSQMSGSSGGSSEPETGELGPFGHQLICRDGKVTEVFVFIFDTLSEEAGPGVD